MTKKARRVSMEPSSSSYPVVGEEARERFRRQILIQDYEELLQETEGKNMKLQIGKQRIRQLSAEVKFLRRKYKSLLENRSQKKVSYPLKTQPKKTPRLLKNRSKNTTHLSKNHSHKPSLVLNVQPQNPEIGSELSAKARSYNDNEATNSRASAVLDLNQVSLPDGEAAEFYVGWEPVGMEKPSTQYPLDGDAMESDLKLSICRDVGNGASRRVKKITWQDQLALRV